MIEKENKWHDLVWTIMSPHLPNMFFFRSLSLSSSDSQNCNFVGEYCFNFNHSFTHEIWGATFSNEPK
jgi:hypothetical protein